MPKKDVFVWVAFDPMGIRILDGKPEMNGMGYWIGHKINLYDLFNTSKTTACKKYKLVEVEGK